MKFVSNELGCGVLFAYEEPGPDFRVGNQTRWGCISTLQSLILVYADKQTGYKGFHTTKEELLVEALRGFDPVPT